jgi:hypothetical protein
MTETGGQSNIHPGNTQWRLLVSANKELYVTLPKKQKMMLSQSIVNAVRSQVPSGRFLQKDMHNDLWYDVGDKRAQEKTSQALREGAPEIRDKLKAHEVATETDDGSTEPPPEPILSATTEAAIKEEPSPEGPPPLDQSPSQEQMPPPRTIPERKEPKKPRSPKASAETTKTAAPPSFEPPPYRSSRPEYNYADTANVEPIPLPQSFVEGHAGCSFGSMGSIGLLSDAEQAKLMRSFLPKTEEAYSSQHPPPSYPQYPRDYTPPPPAGYYQPQHPYSSTPSYPPMDQNYYSYPSSDRHYPTSGTQVTASTASYGRSQYSSLSSSHFDPVPQPVDQGLEPVGLSMGSMMSIGTMGPPEVGFSFGSAMSTTTTRRGSVGRTAPSAPDGGLQDVGMSLGSLSLADGDRERIVAEAERDIAALMRGSDTLPTLLHQQKSKGNLLECSDSEEEEEDGTSAEASAQRSQEHWNRMQATLAEQDESVRNNMRMPTTVELTQHRPPAAGPWYPSSLDRDYSQMSAISVGEDFEQPPGYHGRSLRFSEGIPSGAVVQFDANVPEPGEMPPPLSEP